MWVLSLQGDDCEKTIYLTPAKGSLIVGRSSSNVVLEEDSSISRKHCSLHCADKNSCPSAVSTRTGLWAIDLGSKYGTFYQAPDTNWIKMEPNKAYILQNGYSLRIGVLKHSFRVEYRPLFVTASKISVADRMALQKKFQNIGGDFMNGCDSRVSYLVVEAISLTVKVLQAMTHGIPIVTASFVPELLKCITENKPLPDPRLFQPSLSEAALRTTDVVLTPGHKRTTLFSELNFYTLSTALLKNFQAVVEAAGGTLSLLNYEEKDVLLKQGAVMLEDSALMSSQSSDDSSHVMSQRLFAIREFLEKNGRRTVPDREIPFAIAYSSIHRMCNANMEQFQRPAEVPVSYSQATVLEDRSQPRVMVNPDDFPVHTVEASQPFTQQSQSVPQPSASLPLPSNPTAPNQSSIETILSRKRLSTEASQEEPARKRSSSIDVSRRMVSDRILALESVPEESGTPREEGSRHFVTESQSQNTQNTAQSVQQHPAFDSDDIFTSRPSLLSQRSQSDDNNPFGKRKASIERVQPEVAKKQKPSPVESSFHERQPLKRAEETDKNVRTKIENPKPSTSKDPEFNFTKPQNKAASISSKGSPVRITHPACDADGWIDTSVCKTDADVTMGEALGNTILLLSLVTLAHARTGASAAASRPRTTTTGLQNVKVFRKQTFTGVNETIELDRSGAEFAEEDWTRMTR